LRSRAFQKIISLRGGKDNEDDAFDSSDTDLDFDSEDNGVISRGIDISNNKIISIVKDFWNKTPPITKVYISLSVTLAILTALFNENRWHQILDMNWNAVLFKLQIWRLITAFLYFGPLGINYLLTIHFVWTYMSQMEKMNYRHPEAYLFMLIYGGGTLLLSYSLLGISTRLLGHNLSTFLVYIWARAFEGVDVNVMDLVVIKAELLPWFFCAQSLLLEGEFPFADLIGIAVGHMYHYCLQRKLLTTPKMLTKLFSSERVKSLYTNFKAEFE
jgi:Derlin-2/3